MSLPREPRQKMINMMYLVLTALLALNVSSEILNAFKTVNRSLETTNATVTLSTNNILESLKDKAKDPTTAERATKWLTKANQVTGFSSTVYGHIQTLKDDILKAAGGTPGPDAMSKSFKEDNLDIATRMMVDKGEGKKLKAMLEKYKTDVLGVFKDSAAIATQAANSVQIDLSMPPTKNKGNNTWEAAYFRMVPTVAAMTILSKFQNDVKTTENKLVTLCHEQVGKVEIVFDSYKAIIGQSTNYAMPGQEIEIKAGVGAYSKEAKPTFVINGQSLQMGPEGFASTKINAGTLGEHTVPVTVTYFDQILGKPVTVTENVKYTVGQANASIALDEMNVLYIGYDNKVSITASGAGAERVNASISGGGGSLINQGGGKYIAKVGSVTDDCVISVSVDGKPMGSSRFRVRTIPMPVATIGGVASNENMNAGTLRAQAGVGAYIKDFPLNLKYTVTSFTIVMDDPESGDLLEAACTGNTWSPKAQGMIQRARAGQTLSVEQIRAVGPDGRNQKLPGLTYYIK